MFLVKSISVQHRDLIHDVAYDHYGKRLATCSSDQTVKVWDLDGGSGEWKLTCCWRAHNGSIWRLAWAHPEFGQILATCSFDRSVCIWEEVPTNANAGGGGSGGGGGVGSGVGGRSLATTFEKRAHLVESSLSVSGIQFAPRHVGLQLGTCSNDGYLRIYQFSDIMQISQVSLYCEAIHTKMKNCSCIAWSQSRLHPMLIAAGCSVPVGDLIADASSSSAGGNRENLQIYELQEESRKFAKVESITLPRLEGGVNDVQFAPSLGRSFHLLAVASRRVSLYKLKLASQNQSMLHLSASQSALQGAGGGGGGGKYVLFSLRSFEDHRFPLTVWRVSWNVLGTILASSEEDGTVRLWQGNYADQWKCLTTLAPTSDSQTSSSVDLTQQQQQQQQQQAAALNAAAAMAAVVGVGGGGGLDHQQQQQLQGGVPFAKMGSIQGRHQVVWH